jgi:hypothetical protein
MSVEECSKRTHKCQYVLKRVKGFSVLSTGFLFNALYVLLYAYLAL